MGRQHFQVGILVGDLDFWLWLWCSWRGSADFWFRLCPQPLDAQVDAVAPAGDVDDPHIQGLTHLDHIFGFGDKAFPHLTNMQQRVTPNADVYERTIGQHPRHRAFHHLTLFQVADGALARLDHGQADAVAIPIQLLDPEGDLLAFLQHIGHFADAIHRKLRNMDQPIAPNTNVDKGAKFGDAFYGALKFLADTQHLDDTARSIDCDLPASLDRFACLVQ